MSASGGGGGWGCLHLGGVCSGGVCSGGSALGGVCSGGVCSGGVSAPGGFLLWGCLLLGGCLALGKGVCLLLGGVWPWGGGVCSRGCLLQGGIPACTEAPPYGQTDACKNITFATSLHTVIILQKNIIK